MMALLAFGLGVCWGSFINVLVVRLAAGEKIGGRSRCRSCGRQLLWYHNIPLISFLVLGGKCAWCRKKISWQYPAVELAVGLLFALGTYLMAARAWLWLITFCVLAVYSVALFVFDLRFKVLPDALTLSGAVILFGLNLWRGQSFGNLLLAALAASVFFALQYFISRGRWIGAGDIRLGLFMGAALGWPAVVAALVLAYWLGALVGLGLVIFKHYGPKSELAFGTFLTVSTLAVYLTAETISQWYFDLFGLI